MNSFLRKKRKKERGREINREGGVDNVKKINHTRVPGVATDMEPIFVGGIFYVKHRVFRVLPNTVVVHHLDSQIPEVVPSQFIDITVS